MYELEKINEAKYFLKQMDIHKEDRTAYRHNLSAFISAARSVLQFALEESKQKTGGQIWYDKEVHQTVLSKFFKERRDFNIHREPIEPIKEIGVEIVEHMHANMYVEATVSRNGKMVEEGIASATKGTAAVGSSVSSAPTSVRMTEVYKFKEWFGKEDISTLCNAFLDELKCIVSEGQSRGFLTT